MIKKKGFIDPIKFIMILVITTFIFIFFMLILYQMSDLYIDEKKIKTQSVLSKVFNGRCFSEDFATIEKNKFNKNTFNDCFNNLDSSILFRISLQNNERQRISKYLYAGSYEEMFREKKNYCNLKSNILCTKMTYPITYIDEEQKHSTKILVFESITG